MNFINKSYLHPVLRPGYNDIAGSFSFDLAEKVSIGGGNFLIDIEANFSNPTIQGLITDGKAKIFVFVCCKANFYRKAHEIHSFTERIEIPTAELSDEVDVTIVITAATKLEYKNSTQHPDYMEHIFHISSGDILAVSETCTFYADKEFDSLCKTESIVSIVINKDLKREDPLKISWGESKIQVQISESVYQDYCLLARHLMPQAMNTMIFFPILVSILHEWQSDPQEYEENNKNNRWFRAIRARADHLGILNDIPNTTPYVLAQKLLDAPIARSLEEIKKKTSGTEEGEA